MCEREDENPSYMLPDSYAEEAQEAFDRLFEERLKDDNYKKNVKKYIIRSVIVFFVSLPIYLLFNEDPLWDFILISIPTFSVLYFLLFTWELFRIWTARNLGF